MDMKVIHTCPCHENGHHIRGFFTIVYVIHQISESVDDYKTDLLVLSQSIINESDTKFRRVFTQPPKQKAWVILLDRKP